MSTQTLTFALLVSIIAMVHCLPTNSTGANDGTSDITAADDTEVIAVPPATPSPKQNLTRNSAQVRMCDHIKSGGECLWWDVYYGSCYNIGYLNDRVSSIGTGGACIALYEHIDCFGRTITVAPGTPSHHDLRYYGFSDTASSFRRC